MPGKGKKSKPAKGKKRDPFDVIGATKSAAESLHTAATPGKFIEVPGLLGKFHKWGKIGEVLEGRIVGMRTMKSRFKGKDDQTIFDVQTKTGQVSLGATGRLLDKLRIVQTAFESRAIVRIKFIGTHKVPGLKNKARDFDVQVCPDKGTGK